MVMSAVAAPSELDGKVLVLNYTQALYCYSEDGETLSGWQTYKDALKNDNGCAKVFHMPGLKPKATRQ